MFIRRKQSRGGKVVYQMVATSRVNGKVRQRVVAHLGDAETLQAAITDCEARLKKERDTLVLSLRKADVIKAQLRAVGWKSIPEDYQEIRARARYHWDMKSLRNALWFGERAKRRIPPLEQRLARLLQAQAEVDTLENPGIVIT